MGLGSSGPDDGSRARVLISTKRRRAALAISMSAIIVLSVLLVTKDESQDDGLDFCGTRPPIKIQLQQFDTDYLRVNDTVVWDVWYRCTNITSSGGVPWNSVHFWIGGQHEIHLGGWFAPVSVRSTELPFPQGYFRDVKGGNDTLDEGDELCLAHLNRSHHGMPFRLFITGSSARCEHFLPTGGNPYSLELSVVNVSLPLKGQSIWDVTFLVRRVRPEWEKVPWSYVSTRQLVRSYYAPDRYEHYPVMPISQLREGRSGHLRGYYNDSGEQDGMVSVGDWLMVSGDWSKHMELDGPPLLVGNMTISQMMAYDFPDPTLSFEFSDPNITMRRISVNETVWDAEFTILNITPEEGILKWGRPRVEFDSVWSVHTVPWWLIEDKGDYPTSTQVFYREDGPVDGHVDVGDVIVVKRMTEAFEGIPLKLFGPGTEITLYMPSSFQTPD